MEFVFEVSFWYYFMPIPEISLNFLMEKDINDIKFPGLKFLTYLWWPEFFTPMPFSEGGNWVLRSMMLSTSIWYRIDSPMFLFFTTIESLFGDISELPPQRGL